MQPYDPLHYENLAKSVVQALLGGPDVALPPEPFEGAGVYAIYYHGDFDGYRSLVEASEVSPIYVGKAVPAGARKGGRSPSPGRRELHHRLKEHSESIDQADNLRLEHFTCRYLVVVPVWITLAERFLVDHYQPVWNVAVDGFGNVDQLPQDYPVSAYFGV